MKLKISVKEKKSRFISAEEDDISVSSNYLTIDF